MRLAFHRRLQLLATRYSLLATRFSCIGSFVYRFHPDVVSNRKPVRDRSTQATVGCDARRLAACHPARGTAARRSWGRRRRGRASCVQQRLERRRDAVAAREPVVDTRPAPRRGLSPTARSPRGRPSHPRSPASSALRGAGGRWSGSVQHSGPAPRKGSGCWRPIIEQSVRPRSAPDGADSSRGRDPRSMTLPRTPAAFRSLPIQMAASRPAPSQSMTTDTRRPASSCAHPPPRRRHPAKAIRGQARTTGR